MAAPDLQIQLQEELDSEFQILRLLGEGSVAQVYLARERALQRLVAIKLMKSELAEDETARKRFERESRSAAKIHHNNVATVHRVGALEDETPFIIMEYIEGRNLADLLQAEGVMDIEQASHTLSQVASALAAAHENGIVHRDVKPENVVRQKDSDRVVLTDFGIAGILETGNETITRLTQQGQLLGDPRYMSPEHLLGESVTDESDVYSLGIMGYELLTLKTPYEGTTSVQLVTAHLKREPIPLARLRPDVDPSLAELLERCLSKNPRHRPRASEVAKALEPVKEAPHTTGAHARPDSLASQALLDAVKSVPALERFVGELKRRHVFNVAVFYILVTAGLLGFAEAAFGSLFDDPDRAMEILVALTLGGFPVILVLSWMFDVSSRGIHRTHSEISGSARTKLYVLQALGLLLSLTLAVLVGWWILRS
jgi:serine/threonine protein kinase